MPPRRRKTEGPAETPLYETLDDGEQDDRPRAVGYYQKPTAETIKGLVGISCDDAFWKCIRENFDLRIHTVDGQELSYASEMWKLLPGQKVWAGVWIVVVNDVVTKAWWSEDDGG